MKQQVDHEIERVLKRHKTHCYLTLDDLARFEVMSATQQEVFVLVNAPYNTDINVRQSRSAAGSASRPTVKVTIILPRVDGLIFTYPRSTA